MNALKMIEKLPVEFGLSAEQKQAKLEEIWARGGEGAILKHRDGVYEAVERRPTDGKNLWEKQKKKISNSLGGEDVDAFVTGFKLGGEDTANAGLVSALEFSVILVPSGRQHVIARCSNFTREEKIAMTVKNPDGTITLHPDWMGRVARVAGMDLSSTEGHGSASLVHAQFKGWRLPNTMDYKAPEACTFPEHLLNDLVL